nr:pseudouridine synthase, catalytic domain-containing protein [Tanacetum cinerariifolium]
CSLRIECCTNPDVVNAIMASRPEGVPDDLDGATAPTRPVGLIFNVNVFGIRPAVAAEGGNPAIPAAVYIIGRGSYVGTNSVLSLLSFLSSKEDCLRIEVWSFVHNKVAANFVFNTNMVEENT